MPGGYSDRADLKRYTQVDATDLGLSDSTDSDSDGDSDWEEFLDSLAEKAQARIENFCKRDFADHSNVTVTLDGGGGNSKVMRLPHPVRSVSAVRVDGDTTASEDYAWKEAGTLIKTGGSRSQTTGTLGIGITSGRATWPAGYDNIEVDLTWGYSTPPSDIQEAEMMLVDHTLVGHVQKREAPIVQSDDFSIQANIPLSMTDEVREMLRPYQPSGVSG